MPNHAHNNRNSPPGGKVRYAVVGLGHIAQVAILPAFAHARDNSVLTALVSDDPEKLNELGNRHGIARRYSDASYDEMLASGEVDAVYLALPNHLHRHFAVRAAQAGVHVLCEKPLATTEEECEAMMAAAEENGTLLMTAYRLHFEEANLRAIELARSGQLGDVRIFQSLFTTQAEEGNIRLQRAAGGGTLYDIGIYCINAARCLFGDEPIEVFATAGDNGEARFREVEEMMTCTLRFPGGRLASFTCSFGAADVCRYQLVGTRGDVQLDQAYGYAGEMKQVVTIDGKRSERTFARRDQFAPELLYFSECILTGKHPEPSGGEGLADVRVIGALSRSAKSGRPEVLPPFHRSRRPSMAQEIERPPVQEPEPINARSPSGN